MKTLDPYWSLWGRLKSHYQQTQHILNSDEYDEGGGMCYKIAQAELEELNEKIFVLPVSRIKVTYDGSTINGHKVTCDIHAVNYLKKIDNK
jgi:hypothetical protein